MGAALAVGLFDLLTWGRPFSSLIEFARYTLVEEQASAEVARQPGYWYLWRLSRWLPLSLLPLLWFVPRCRASVPAWAFVLWPLLLLSLIHHKDLRYTQSLLPFVALLAAAGGLALWGRGRRRTVAILVALAVAYGLGAGHGHVNRRSLAAAAAAERLAGEPGLRKVALSQAWAWGYRLFLGNEVAIADLPVRPSAADLDVALAGCDRVGLYLVDVEANPDLERVLGERGLLRSEVVVRGGSKPVVLFAGDAARQLGLSLYSNGELIEARDLWQAALGLDEANEVLLQYLGEVQERLRSLEAIREVE